MTCLVISSILFSSSTQHSLHAQAYSGTSRNQQGVMAMDSKLGQTRNQPWKQKWALLRLCGRPPAVAGRAAGRGCRCWQPAAPQETGRAPSGSRWPPVRWTASGLAPPPGARPLLPRRGTRSILPPRRSSRTGGGQPRRR
ncbi:unnamed protein product, partial [Heterosigma akashiwo]